MNEYNFNDKMKNIKSCDDLYEKANQIRRDVVTIAVKNKVEHIAPSLSTVDILVALYYGIMNISDNPQWEDRDRFVLSKGHGCYALYSILTDMGYLQNKKWDSFFEDNSLTGCIKRNVIQGIEAGTGALGHGLPIATGIAFGAKLQNKKYRVYCLTGDGEMQEGSNWEAIQFAVKHHLTNLTIIIDHNRLQAMDFLENILLPEEKENYFEKIMDAFGCCVGTCDGHNPGEIISVIKKWIDEQVMAPQVLITRTIKGFGLTCMENIPKFHYRMPTKEEFEMGGIAYEK